MNPIDTPSSLTRRDFCRLVTATGVAAALAPLAAQPGAAQEVRPHAKPATNADEARKHPRTSLSMPGPYPGRVIHAFHDRSMNSDAPDGKIVAAMVEKSLLALTGASTVRAAWRQFVTPEDVVGLKVNPIGGKLLSTSHEIVWAVIRQLEDAGVPRKNILIWDRREFELHEAGFTADLFPGILITGTERKDAQGSFYNKAGKLYGEEMIDRDWFYWADVEGTYDQETLPYMINEGKHSYFSTICTRQVTKIINMPILKNAGSSVTLALKNLAFGAISNTGRLHKDLWAETCAEVPMFPVLRDKVVLNIVDGIKGCYEGGPGADPQFFTEYKTILVGTDPVAVDRAGYDIVLKKRLEEKIQKEESPRGRKFLELAEQNGLGLGDPGKVNVERIVLS